MGNAGKGFILAIVIVILVAVALSKIPGAEQMISYHDSTAP